MENAGDLGIVEDCKIALIRADLLAYFISNVERRFASHIADVYYNVIYNLSSYEHNRK